MGLLRQEAQAGVAGPVARARALYVQIPDSDPAGVLSTAPPPELELLEVHADTSPKRLLFLWNLFEGVPKFYRDCYEQGVINLDRRRLPEKMFLSGSSPLRTEAENWFLRELRGRYDLVLKYVEGNPGCTHGAPRRPAGEL